MDKGARGCPSAIALAVVAVACLIAACFLCRRCPGGRGGGVPAPAGSVRVDTVRVDTVRVALPAARDTVYVGRVVVRYRTDTVHAAGAENPADTVVRVDTVAGTVSVPITRTVYRGANYTAVVSGYRARLDSIETYNKTETRKQPRFSIGVGGGYYVTPKGLQPGIGVTLQYNLFNIR